MATGGQSKQEVSCKVHRMEAASTSTDGGREGSVREASKGRGSQGGGGQDSGEGARNYILSWTERKAVFVRRTTSEGNE